MLVSLAIVYLALPSMTTFTGTGGQAYEDVTLFVNGIAALYPGATRDNIVVTIGAAQANLTTILTLMDPGDEILVMLPNYMQIWGLSKSRQYRMKFSTHSLARSIVGESKNCRENLKRQKLPTTRPVRSQLVRSLMH